MMRPSTLLLATAALATALIATPTPAKADPTLAVALGGSALFVSLSQALFSHSHPNPPPTHQTVAVTPYHPQPVIYQTVSPVIYQQPPIIMMAVPNY